jgi:MFS family permease
LRLIIIIQFAAFGIVIGLLGIITSTWLDFALLFLLGLGNGFVVVILMTWMQARTPREMLGRMMALLMFASTGLMPVSQALAGVLSKWNLTMLFVLPGLLVLLLTAWVAFRPELKGFSESLTATQAQG